MNLRLSQHPEEVNSQQDHSLRAAFIQGLSQMAVELVQLTQCSLSEMPDCQLRSNSVQTWLTSTL